AHLARADAGRARPVDVGGTQTARERFLHRRLHASGLRLEIEAVAQHHRGRKYGRQRVRDVTARDVRGGAVDGFIEALVVRVERAELVPALRSGAERDLGDAPDLGLAVAHGVEALASAAGQLTDAARLAEIDVAGELAHDQQVEAGDDVGLDGRGPGELRVDD